MLKTHLWELEEGKSILDAKPWILDTEEARLSSKRLFDTVSREVPKCLSCRLVKEEDEAGVTEITKDEWEKALVMRPKHNTAKARDVCEDDLAKSTT